MSLLIIQAGQPEQRSLHENRKHGTNNLVRKLARDARAAVPRPADTKQNAAHARAEIETFLQRHAFAPFHGLAGEEVANVLQVNL